MWPDFFRANDLKMRNTNEITGASRRLACGEFDIAACQCCRCGQSGDRQEQNQIQLICRDNLKFWIT